MVEYNLTYINDLMDGVPEGTVFGYNDMTHVIRTIGGINIAMYDLVGSLADGFEDGLGKLVAQESPFSVFGLRLNRVRDESGSGWKEPEKMHLEGYHEALGRIISDPDKYFSED
jgi:hypothetical protein